MRSVNLIVVLSVFVVTSGFAQQSELIFGEPEKLPATINSGSEEALLVFSRDSSTLFFVREHPENIGGINDQDIWFSKKDENGQYTPAKNLKQLNNKDFNAVVGNSLDGNTIYLYNAYVKKKNQLDRGIAVANKKSNGWTSPTKLEIKNFKLEGDHFGFYVNPQETVILISYKGKDSNGEEDLYVSLKQTDGSWGEPFHLGNVINSSGYEMSPFLSEDGYSLFFSSNGHGGYGDADIFVCFRQDETWKNWTKPQNLGDKVNSPAFDAYFIMSQNEAYFTSNRDGEMSDIYKVIPIEPEETVVEETPVVVENKTTTEPAEKVIRKIPSETKIYFATNSSYMEGEAKTIVDQIIDQMKGDPSIKCDISSHADIRASEDYNIWLTERRAKRVKDYMVLKGIDPSRIDTFWHGKKNPVVRCADCTEEEFRLSRRTILTLYQ